MNKVTIVILAFLAIGCSYDGPAEVSGVWSRNKTYQEWKNGKNELIVSTDVRIGSEIYWGLTNSVEISVLDDYKYIAVPGGKWLIIKNEMINNSKYKLTVVSTKDTDSRGEVLVNFNSPNEIYFVRGGMDPKVLDEMSQAFIFWDSKETYTRCDRKSALK
ncbi:MAG: hypothetical protein JNG85_00470 [Spirochaetaceae bacterium]|nr:hypothetical protein [Spirochaetaceae bacterium]